LFSEEFACSGKQHAHVDGAEAGNLFYFFLRAAFDAMQTEYLPLLVGQAVYQALQPGYFVVRYGFGFRRQASVGQRQVFCRGGGLVLLIACGTEEVEAKVLYQRNAECFRIEYLREFSSSEPQLAVGLLEDVFGVSAVLRKGAGYAVKAGVEG
jgi:hypothetical protein